MPVNSRAKGARFEREIAKLIEDKTGFRVQRNLEQYRNIEEGDLIGIPGWIIECKIRAKGFWWEESWWQQAVDAAAKVQAKPALIYRFNNQPPRVVVRTKHHALNRWIPVTMDFVHWLEIVNNERLLQQSTLVTGQDDSQKNPEESTAKES